MKIKQFVFFLTVSVLFALTASSKELAYKESTSGNYFYLNPFAHKPVSPADHWDYAVALREKGKLSAARKQFEVLVKRWPESAQAAGAKQAVGDIYFEQGKDKKSFETYEELIKTYYTGLKNYDGVLENQYAIAQREMERKRMRWLFGGYRAPERAIPYLESILKNAPQWDRAPEIQSEIGQAYQQDGNYDMAVIAYSTVEYRYPDSSFAEQASFAKVQCLQEMVKKTPYSVDIREQAQLASAIFMETYKDSEHRAEIEQFADELADQAAAHDFEIGRFYERIPKPPRNDSAKIYYESVIEEHPETSRAAAASQRLRVMFPVAPSVGGEAVADGEVAVEPVPVPETVPEIMASISSDTVTTTPSVSTGGGSARKPLPEVGSPDAVEVTADRLEYESGQLIGKGNVAVQQEGASLQADYVSVNQETGDITAMGNIVMLYDGNRWEGEKLLYNFKTREGNFGPSSMYFEPAYITAEKTEQVSSNEYRMVNARITTCSGSDPIVYAKAGEVRLIDEDKPGGRFIKAKHVTFYVGDIPVFYTPYWQRHLGYRVFSFSVGYSGRLGAFVMGRAVLRPTDWLTTTSHLDLYSDRGVGLGQDFRWSTPRGQGGIKTYYISDNDPLENDDLTAAEQALIDSQRYRVHLDHQEQISDETYFRTEVNWLSDPTVLEDFFNDEFRQNVNPENYAVLQHSADSYAAGVRVDRSANDFYTTVERMPEASFDWYRAPLGDLAYFQNETRAGFYEMQHAETNILPSVAAPDYRSARFDTYNQVFLPLRIKEFFNVIPRAAYRGTWYGDTPAGSAEYRNIVELGTLSSFKAHKKLTDQSGFYGTGLRHVVEPYADYLYRYSDIETNLLYQFDNIDELDDRNEVRFGMRNFLQTKRGARRVVNFLDTDLYTSYRLDRNTGEKDFGPLVANLDMSLTDDFRIQSDLEYDMHAGQFDEYNARAHYLATDSSQYSLEYRYLADTRSLVAASTELFPNNDWSYQFLVRYDATLNEWRERRFLVNHRFDCIGLGLGLKVDEDDEPSLWLHLWLNAFGSDSDSGRL
ncbi:LPS assembly protein LptD [Tichowtungia aerotolerans]|uniref:LPS assembly protein LptD n=1 Tax=Tichowtungia aerotolerans TaxID=2697043 RepID=A0A6P1M4C2_9BACT|nr:LPS assembly protein LptD [Tichowtungia aerotolerans]QHI69679.1 LPS assembly protein LptD [Tichowtungia aerotolerans]